MAKLVKSHTRLLTSTSSTTIVQENDLLLSESMIQELNDNLVIWAKTMIDAMMVESRVVEDDTNGWVSWKSDLAVFQVCTANTSTFRNEMIQVFARHIGGDAIVVNPPKIISRHSKISKEH